MASLRNVFFTLLWFIATIPTFADDPFCVNGFIYSIMKDHNSVKLIGFEIMSKTNYSQTLHIPASITFEDKTYSVKMIDIRALKDVTEVQSIVIDEGIENIGKYAFECCTNLKSISIPSSVKSIGEGIFGSCYNLTSVVVDANNENFDSREDSNAIIDSDNDELIVACSSTKIPISVKSIGDFAFYHCNLMEQLVIPEGVKSIGHHAFFGCSSLKTIVLPESLTEIGAGAFDGCNSLISMVIPKNVKSIAEGNIFMACNSLTSVVVDSANPNYDSRSNCNGIVRKSDSALIASCRHTSLSNDIAVLGDYCFEGTIIHSVNIHNPNSVTVEGIVTDFSSPQKAKALCPMLFTPSGRLTCRNFSQESKARSPIEVIPCGITTSSSWLHRRKALVLTLVTLYPLATDGIVTFPLVSLSMATSYSLPTQAVFSCSLMTVNVMEQPSGV